MDIHTDRVYSYAAILVGSYREKYCRRRLWVEFLENGLKENRETTTVSLANLLDMTFLATSGRLQIPTEYYVKVHNTGPQTESNNLVRA